MRNSKMKGFTLIELIVVIAIIGVLAAILVPSMIGYVGQSKLSTANSNAKLAFTYGKIAEDEAYGPTYYRSFPEEDCFIIEFKHAKSGFDLRNEDTPSGFELAGDDKEYHPAAAQILSGGKIRLTCPNVKEPKFARFRWVNYGDVTQVSQFFRFIRSSSI